MEEGAEGEEEVGDEFVVELEEFLTVVDVEVGNAFD